MSTADLMAVLLDGYLRLDTEDPGNPHNGRHAPRPGKCDLGPLTGARQ